MFRENLDNMGNNTKVVFHTTEEQGFADLLNRKFIPLLDSEEEGYCQSYTQKNLDCIWLFDLRKANTEKLERALMLLSIEHFKDELITVSDHYNPDRSYAIVRGKLTQLCSKNEDNSWMSETMMGCPL